MPLMRYFVFVGGALLALLLIASASLSTPPVVADSRSAVDLSVIRIHSDTKWPERVVFDTSRPTAVPAATPAPIVAEMPAPQIKKSAVAEPAKTQVREAFAELRPNPNEPRNVEPKRKRKSVARNYAGPPSYGGQPRILVAQQRPMLFFGNNVW